MKTNHMNLSDLRHSDKVFVVMLCEAQMCLRGSDPPSKESYRTIQKDS